jgi:hypothetical protein
MSADVTGSFFTEYPIYQVFDLISEISMSDAPRIFETVEPTD